MQSCLAQLCLGHLFRIQQCVMQMLLQKKALQWSTAPSNPAQCLAQTQEEIPVLMVGVFLFICFCIYTLSCIINASAIFFDVTCVFSHHISLALACASLSLIFLPTANHPPSPSLSAFRLDHFPSSLQYRPPSAISLSSLYLSLSCSLPPSSIQVTPSPSPSPVSKAVYQQLQSHLSVQFIFPCSLWRRVRGKTTSCLPKETSGSHRHLYEKLGKVSFFTQADI